MLMGMALRKTLRKPLKALGKTFKAIASESSRLLLDSAKTQNSYLSKKGLEQLVQVPWCALAPPSRS